MAPSIMIQNWRYTRVATEQASYTAEVMAAGLTPATATETTVVETVAARFEIIGGEPFGKTERSVNKVRPEALHLSFRSINGDAWRLDYGFTLTGSNIKRDGTLGAEQRVSASDFPEWVRELITTEKYSYTPAGYAAEWIEAEYPR
jgi:hypothetical protein